MMAALRKFTTFSNPHSLRARPKQTRDRNVGIDAGPKPGAKHGRASTIGLGGVDGNRAGRVIAGKPDPQNQWGNARSCS
jgi:hypothetical protein